MALWLFRAPALPRPMDCAAGTESSAAIVPDRIIPLFNGTNLAGLTTWLVDTKHSDPRRVFTVTNGLLRISGEGLGYLATEQRYRDYELRVEFRWGHTNWPWGNRIGAARDSGIFLHASGPHGNSHDGKGAFMAAIECQIMQGAVGDLLLIRGNAADGSLIAPSITVEAAVARDTEGWPAWQPGGPPVTLQRWGRVNWRNKSPGWRDMIDFRGPNDVETPDGWTALRCLCAGDRIEVFVNGAQVNAARNVVPDEGRILLQCEGSEIFFRRVELHPLQRR